MTELVEYDYQGEKIRLTARDVYGLVNGGGQCTAQEVSAFLELCKYRGLNPFLKEAYLIKYGNSSPATTVVSYDVYRKRADENPLHVGIESGIVVQRRDNIEKREGACVYPGEKLIGGWARVCKAKKVGDTWRDTFYYKEASMQEYSTGKSGWAKMPGTMIEKVAISQALRAAYPNDFQGLYTSEEMSRAMESGSYTPTAPTQEPQEPQIQTITRTQAEALNDAASLVYGEMAQSFIRKTLAVKGWERLGQMSVEYYAEVMDALDAAMNRKLAEQNAEPLDESEPLPFREDGEGFDELMESGAESGIEAEV